MAIKTDTFQGAAGGGGAVTSVNTQTGAVVLSANDLAADHSATNYTAANSNIDGHLSGIDTKLGTIASGLTYKGTFDATAGTPSLTNALKGDLYVIDTAGTIYGQTWAVGDHLLINEDMGGTITNSKIDKIDNTDQVTSVNGDTGAVTVNLQSVTDQSGVTTGTVQAGILKSPTVRVGTGVTYYELPSADGSSNQVLATDGAGSLFFKNESAAAAASETVAGVIEIATNAEATAATATDKALVPSNISSLDLSTMDNTTAGFISSVASASETVQGIIEIATNAEAAAGTATDKALVPSNISSLDLSAMDNTTAGFIANINSESLNDLSDVSYTAGAGIDNYVLKYDHSTTSWGAEAETTAAAASETVAGVIEIATNAEAAAATATDKALVPSNISSLDLSDMDNSTAGFISSVASASETVQGIIEIATNTEAAAGTATDKALVPSNISSLDLSAMDNTTSGFIANINSESLNDLSDVSYTAGAGIDNYVLTYDHSTTSWGAEAAASGGLSEVVQDLTPQLGGNLDVNGNSITSASNGNVTINPDGTGDISIGADIIPDADATHTIGDEDNRFISYYGDMNGAIRFKAKNDQGGQITKGQVVYIKGLAGDGTTPTVALADADDSAKMPAFGLAFNTANDQAEVQIVSFGNLGGLDTSGFTVGDTLFVGTTAGALVATKPTGETSLLQNIGRVIRSNNGAGVIMVGGAGRSAATPNLDQNKVFLGNASNQAVSTALSSIALSSFNDDLNYLSNVSEDTTPQLGGNLDVNGQDIVSASNGDIEIAPNGTGSTVLKGNATGGSGHIKFNCEQNTHAVTIKGPAHSATATYTLTLPTSDGDADQVLKTDGSGVLSWVDQPAGASPASETVAGVIEIATNVEAAAATATNKALVPSNISSLDLSDMDNSTAGFISSVASASETVAGVIEIATNAEAGAATATDKALVPSNIASLDLSAMDNTTSGFIADVVSDTTPQLGGNLDVNGNAITSASNGLVEITPNGTGAVKLGGNTNPAELRFFDEAGTNYVALKAPLDSAISANETFTLPATDGTNGQVLQTNGSGVLSFVNQSGGGSAPTVTTDSSGTNTTITSTTGIEEIHLISNSTNNVTITVPTGSTAGSGYKYQVKRLGTGTVSVQPSSGTIDGAASFSLASQYDSVTIVSDGTNYHII